MATSNTYDVIITGAGPIGAYTAWQIAQAGYAVALLEEHHTIGTPVKCAGLITPRVFNTFNIPKNNIIQNTITGAHIHSPNNHILTITGDRTHAYVINRIKFDQHLTHQATTHHATLLTHTKLTAIDHTNQTINVTNTPQNTQRELSYRILIGADGAHSTVRHRGGFPLPTEYLRGIGAELTDTNLNPDYVEIFLGQHIAPGFFAWIIPTNDTGTTARIGLCVTAQATHPIKTYFQRLYNHPYTKKHLSGSRVTQTTAGSIPLGPLNKTTQPHIMLVGDAAAQVKPTSGGGIYPGLCSAAHCATTAITALKTHTTNTLTNYHKQWTQDIYRELRLGMRFRSIFTQLSDTQINQYLEKMNNPKTIEIITAHGDIDYPSRLVIPLVKRHPSLLTLFPSALKKPVHLRGGGGT